MLSLSGMSELASERGKVERLKARVRGGRREERREEGTQVWGNKTGEKYISLCAYS